MEPLMDARADTAGNPQWLDLWPEISGENRREQTIGMGSRMRGVFNSRMAGYDDRWQDEVRT
ncbi:MAG: hypothetical protein ACREO8_02940 [Luteimonas sp.]